MSAFRPVLIFLGLAVGIVFLKTLVQPPLEIRDQGPDKKITKDENIVRRIYDRYHTALLERDIDKLRQLHTRRSSKETATESPEWDFKPFNLDKVPPKYKLVSIDISDFIVHIEAESSTTESNDEVTYSGRIYMELEDGVLKVKSCRWERYRNGNSF